MRKVVLFTILCLLIVGVFPAQMQDATTEYPAIVVPDTHTIDLTSPNTEHDYTISVALPENYASSEQTYPVLYVLDPSVTFLTTTDMVRYMAWFHQLPELIVVGIGYPPDATPLLRNQDYVVSKD